MDHNNEMEIHMNLLLVEDDINLGKILKKQLSGYTEPIIF